MYPRVISRSRSVDHDQRSKSSQSIRDECRGHASSPGTIGQVLFIVRFPSRANIEIGIASPSSSSTAISAVAIAKPAGRSRGWHGMNRHRQWSCTRVRAARLHPIVRLIAILVRYKRPTETLSWGMYRVVECSSCYRIGILACKSRSSCYRHACHVFAINRCSSASQ